MKRIASGLYEGVHQGVTFNVWNQGGEWMFSYNTDVSTVYSGSYYCTKQAATIYAHVEIENRLHTSPKLFHVERSKM